MLRLFIVALVIALIPVRLSASEPASQKYLDDQTRCVAEAVYFEARNQNILGQIAVAMVIRNRMKHPRWPSSACAVVKEGRYWKGNPVRHKCQFSYWCDGKSEKPLESKAWQKSLYIAEEVIQDRISIESLVEATHYHTLKVKPSWSTKYRLCAVIGDHKFYDRKI
jgi:spore germination cell wall hydrolase CwlJ-like protein|tara:strand:+ start:1825 stop:2322 length:498 start_codon:yes stop_codon:yes gene_type:complete